MAARPLSMSDVRAVIDPDELYAEAQGSGSAPYRVSVA